MESDRIQSMIRKSMPSGHDPMGGHRFSLATNAKRLRGDHAQTKRWSGMTIRRKVIPLWGARIPQGHAARIGMIRPNIEDDAMHAPRFSTDNSKQL